MRSGTVRVSIVCLIGSLILLAGCAGIPPKGVVVITSGAESESDASSGAKPDNSQAAGRADETPAGETSPGEQLSDQQAESQADGSVIVISYPDDVAMEAEYPMVALPRWDGSRYAIGRYEVTNELLVRVLNDAIDSGDAVMTDEAVIRGGLDLLHLVSPEYGENSGIFGYGGRLGVIDGQAEHPAVGMTWYGAVVFCNLLSVEAGLEPVYDLEDWTADSSRSGYRLPTFEEWAWAGRGGLSDTEYAYPGSNDPAEVAWYAETSGGSTRPVGLLQPNQIGLYDMVGNVWEWCWDSFDNAYDGAGQDDSDNASGAYRAWAGYGWNSGGLRGWADYPNVRSSATSDNDLGIRLVRRQ